MGSFAAVVVELVAILVILSDDYNQAGLLRRRRKIRRVNQHWRDSPSHPSLRFKKVRATLTIYFACDDPD